ncbi:hypothetical protein [Planctomicrobium sp. SH527]
MTGYTVHTGSNDKFRDGWGRIFDAKSKKKSGEAKSSKDATPKPTSRKKK